MRIVSMMIVFTMAANLAVSQTDTINRFDRNGARSGYWIGYYPEGGVEYTARFVNGKPIDTLTRYYEDGTVKALIIKDPSSDLYEGTLFDSEGQLRAKGHYLNQAKEGQWSYYSSEQIALIQVTYRQDTLHGPAQRYYANGSLMEITNWKKFELDGVRTLFNEQGQKVSEVSYANNQIHGPYKVFGENGYMLVYGMYDHGLQDGKWQYFDENGQADFQLIYESGKLLNPEALENLQSDSFERFESNRNLLRDPRDYLDDPGLYLENRKK